MTALPAIAGLPAPFKYTSGPRDARIAIVGDAWGEQEDLTGMPFIGHSGQELTRMLTEAGITRSAAFLTNVFPLRPTANKIESLCGSKAEVGKDYPHPQLSTGKYILWEYLPYLERLKNELENVAPHLVIALGNTACWALMGTTKIGSIRGVVAESSLVPGLKVLPTYHPSAILRNWALRPIVVADLMKAKREAAFPEIIRPKRTVLINPMLDEIAEWCERPAQMYACDIETGAKQIKCVGFARSRSDALVIPFVDLARPGGNYWESLEDEVRAWGYVRQLLECPIPKLFQNGMYDLQYLARVGMRSKAVIHDTMLLHHSLFPELQKGLGFLGSIYTNEASWKLMNRPGYGKDVKKDE